MTKYTLKFQNETAALEEKHDHPRAPEDPQQHETTAISVPLQTWKIYSFEVFVIFVAIRIDLKYPGNVQRKGCCLMLEFSGFVC